VKCILIIKTIAPHELTGISHVLGHERFYGQASELCDAVHDRCHEIYVLIMNAQKDQPR